jgi:hypothetical protein
MYTNGYFYYGPSEKLMGSINSGYNGVDGGNHGEYCGDAAGLGVRVDMVLLSILLNVKTNSFYRAII